jgi:aminopeptidase-like protein
MTFVGEVPADVPARMLALIEELYPICRSITGDGVRETLRILGRRGLPIELHEVPSGTQVFDWTVPKEWNVRDAWVKDPEGRKVVDFQRSNLHLLGYSIPRHERVSRAELLAHLHSSPNHPDWIPYRNSFYREDWGFCIAHRELERIDAPEYEVFIDSTLREGHLTYGEVFVPGREEQEILIWTHVCHPSLANDNLSGIAVAAELAASLLQGSQRYSYRIVFAPTTIGAITWLCLNEARARRIAAGLVLAVLGDGGHPHYVRSRRGDTLVDRAAAHVLRASARRFEIKDFSPYGYDQRQFCSPGFDLPVGCMMRTPNGAYPQYHTSGDDLSIIDPPSLVDSLTLVADTLTILDQNLAYLNQNPNCEPQLGKRGIYGAIGGKQRSGDDQMALLWVLNLSDGRHTLLDIAERSGIAFRVIADAARLLTEYGLLSPAPA